MRIILIILLAGCTSSSTSAKSPPPSLKQTAKIPAVKKKTPMVVEHYHASEDSHYTITIDTLRNKMMYSADSIVASPSGNDGELKKTKLGNESLKSEQGAELARMAKAVDWNHVEQSGCRVAEHAPEDLPGDLWSIRSTANSKSYWCPRGTKVKGLSNLATAFEKWRTNVDPAIAIMTDSQRQNH